jgi:hypothetical protein
LAGAAAKKCVFPNGKNFPARIESMAFFPDRENEVLMGSVQVNSVADFGKVVRTQRKKLALTQSDAAGLLGVGVRFLSELERGKETLAASRA